MRLNPNSCNRRPEDLTEPHLSLNRDFLAKPIERGLRVERYLRSY